MVGLILYILEVFNQISSLLINWGYGSPSQAINFAASFSNTDYALVYADRGGGFRTNSLNAKSETSFTFVQTGGNSSSISYIAVGT